MLPLTSSAAAAVLFGEPRFLEVMSAQDATQAIINGTSRGASGSGGGYGAVMTQSQAAPGAPGAEGVSGNLPGVPEASGNTDVSEVAGGSGEDPRPSVSTAAAMVAPAGAAVSGRDVSDADGGSGLQSAPQYSGQPADGSTGLATAVGGADLLGAEVPAGGIGVTSGFFTPRSLSSQFVASGNDRSGNGANWAGWVSRLGEIFSQPTMPTPFSAKASWIHREWLVDVWPLMSRPAAYGIERLHCEWLIL